MIKKCTVHCTSFKLLVSHLMGRVSELGAGLAPSTLKNIKNYTSSLKVTKEKKTFSMNIATYTFVLANTLLPAGVLYHI